MTIHPLFCQAAISFAAAKGVIPLRLLTDPSDGENYAAPPALQQAQAKFQAVQSQ